MSDKENKTGRFPSSVLSSVRLREARKAKGYTIDDLAKIVGVSRATINNYERGVHEPKLEMWEKLANELGTSVPYLQGLTDIKENLEQFSQNSSYAEIQQKIKEGEKLSDEERMLAAKFYISARLITSIDKLNSVVNILELPSKNDASKFSNIGLAEFGLNTIEWIVQVILNTEASTKGEGLTLSVGDAKDFLSDIQNAAVDLIYGNNDKFYVVNDAKPNNNSSDQQKND